ncbi:glyoxylate reductase/hydroxypyruvate reductase [Aplysia californica]|uniref:Glyoxylate reductase/hydroxypyruvate reductase n=1 Tax=Aplysia californica TaxID=6500 RepID=A0ABM1AEE7_APLCA|nr:glyoxylate reductase/hydroxypyruvate reductase [Aplysia californica]XP_012946100.1 glyoxylate reductase/hydroxypyruvate reductase [Aplysia californica]XP_035829438.1 glyoxylate reductase/hydroxypyruvate reductase [Aplysia californica]
MTKPRVYVTRQVHDEALELLREKCSVEVWNSDELVPRDELLKKVKGVDAIFCTINDIIDEEVLNAAGPQLKTVATMSVGTHHISTYECKSRNIYVANTPDVASDSAAELTVALLLVTARRCLEGIEAVKNGEWGKWKPMWICGTELAQRNLGILGFGRVGFGVARRMKPFGVKRILYHDVVHACMGDDLNAEYVDLDTLLQESDFLVITCALNGITQGLFRKEIFKKMKSTAILINTSRGPIVKTDDLTEALQNGEIAAAGLDITDPEPLPTDHPLHAMDNCIILPHLGTNTTQARLDMAINTAKNILAMVCPR